MSFESSDIPGSLLSWTAVDVLKWLSTLTLSQDYSNKFREHNITGAQLLKLNPSALDNLGISDASDRVKFLQQITTMQADLMISPPSPTKTKRIHSPVRARRFSEVTRPVYRGGYSSSRQPANNGTSPPTKFGYGERRGGMGSPSKSREHYVSPVNFRMGSPSKSREHYVSPVNSRMGSPSKSREHYGSPVNSRMGSPSKSREHYGSPVNSQIGYPSKSREHYASPVNSRMGSPSKSQEHYGSPVNSSAPSSPYKMPGLEEVEFRSRRISATATLREHNKKRLSRSLDGLFQNSQELGEFPSVLVERHDSGSSRLVEILREENTILKRELETYYQRVRKLQKLEQEMERIREAHRILEETTTRKGRLEASMRARLEQEVQRLREDSLQYKADMHLTRKQDRSSPSKGENRTKGDPSRSRAIQRRDTMIVRLIKQNKESASVRERLEQDLHSTKVALRERERRSSVDNRDSPERRPELETKASTVYSESIEKLRSVLSAMQNISQKREGLEKRLRGQLEAEIRQLRGERRVEEEGEGVERMQHTILELQAKVASLEADVAKWEHKCLELVAEREMVVEAAVIPRDTRITVLEQTVAEQKDALLEAQRQRSHYVSQLSETQRRTMDLESRLSSLQASVEEKDAVIQMLQLSFLEPEESDNDEGMFFPQGSPLLFTKKPSLNGSPVSLSSGSPLSGSMGEIPGPYSVSPPMKHWDMHNSGPFTNGGGLGHTRHNDIPPSNGHHMDYPMPQATVNSPHLRHLGAPLSHSAPNTPRIRRPRASHPNITLSTESSAPASIVTSPANHRRRRGITKSRTPPPNYRVAGPSHESRQKRRSIDGLLDYSEPAQVAPENGIDLFESLIGNSPPPKVAPFVGSTRFTHQHSKSSPTYPHKVHL